LKHLKERCTRCRCCEQWKAENSLQLYSRIVYWLKSPCLSSTLLCVMNELPSHNKQLDPLPGKNFSMVHQMSLLFSVTSLKCENKRPSLKNGCHGTDLSR